MVIDQVARLVEGISMRLHRLAKATPARCDVGDALIIGGGCFGGAGSASVAVAAAYLLEAELKYGRFVF